MQRFGLLADLLQLLYIHDLAKLNDLYLPISALSRRVKFANFGVSFLFLHLF